MTHNCTFGHLSQRNEILCLHKIVFVIVHTTFICNIPKLETNKISYNTMECYSEIKGSEQLIQLV